MVLVTGAAGFIGHHLIKKLLDRNIKVVGIDNFSNNNTSLFFYKKRMDEIKHNNFKFYNIDITKEYELDNVFKKYDFCNIVHLAAKTGIRESVINANSYLVNNIQGTLNILKMMVKYGRKQMTFGSTSSLYDDSFAENSNVNPISPYAASKGSAEMYCQTYSYLYDLNITTLRFFSVYGSLGRPDMGYSKFIDGIKNDKEIIVYGNGGQKRDFTYVDDITDGIIKSFVREKYNLYNLGKGESTSINGLINKIEKILNKKAKIKYEEKNKADMFITKANNTKASNELNWTPIYSLDEGLKRILT